MHDCEFFERLIRTIDKSVLDEVRKPKQENFFLFNCFFPNRRISPVLKREERFFVPNAKMLLTPLLMLITPLSFIF